MELCILNLLIVIYCFFCVILTVLCSLRACHMWLTRNHMFIREIWGKFTLFIFWNFEISLVSHGRFQNIKNVNSVNLSQISLLNMWLLVLINHYDFHKKRQGNFIITYQDSYGNRLIILLQMLQHYERCLLRGKHYR